MFICYFDGRNYARVQLMSNYEHMFPPATKHFLCRRELTLLTRQFLLNRWRQLRQKHIENSTKLAFAAFIYRDERQ